MTNVTLNNVSTFVNDTTAVNIVNNNNTAITTALGNCLARDAEVPNQMNTNLDMNSNQILNLPAPTSANSPARLVDIVSNPSLTLTIPPVGTSGAVVGLLNGNNTYSGVSTFTGATSFNPTPTFVLAPATNGNTLVADGTKWNSVATSGIATQNNAGVLTAVAGATPIAAIANQPGLSVIANAGTSSAAVAPVTGTTRQILAVNTAGTALAFAQPRGDQLLGNSDGTTAASAGNVGEVIRSDVLVGSAASISTGVAKTITSIVLTPGDWNVTGWCAYLASAAAQVPHLIAAGLSLTGATLDQTVGRTVFTGFGSDTFTSAGIASTGTGLTVALTISANVGACQFSITTNTTIFLIGYSNFTTSGTQTAYGSIWARRMR